MIKRLKQWVGALFGAGPPVVSVVRLSGVIAPAGRFARALNILSLGDLLDRAFEGRRLKAVALVINSPGGSPAQSMLVFERIRALAGEKGLPVYAFAEDVAASGGYMLACAADEIYALDSSIVGSIGVIAATFGFDRLIERAGIERRLYTAGARKSLLDPFLPARDEDIRRLGVVQQDLHESFKALVRQRRGSRLKGSDEELFSGEFWTGRRGEALGLVDGIGDVRGEMRKRFGPDVRFRLMEPDRRFRLAPFGLEGLARHGRRAPRAEPAAFLDEALGLIEARALWARFGL